MHYQVKIMSGIPGAGKSTWIKNQEWSNNCYIVSADHAFTDENGEYRFDVSKLELAHSSCLKSFIAACQHGFMTAPVVVVDNTNLRAEEIAPYYAIARAYGYEVELVTILADPSVAWQRNIHGVPLESVKRMNETLNRRMREGELPPFWKMKYLYI